MVLNNTRVLKRRVFAGDLEILFLKHLGERRWQVLFPAKRTKIGEVIELPLGRRMTLLEKGRPQLVEMDAELDENYFSQVGELPLPPYIQKARGERHTESGDESWYQTAWAKSAGSFAAPTASLHFSLQDIESLKTKGVHVVEITLHVGLGTFLPVTTEDLNDHDMHEEFVEISGAAWTVIQTAKREGRKIWSLGTTSTRSIESAALGLLPVTPEQGFSGFTKLLIQPGYKWQIVDCLLTNFHQPESTLLALVASFSDLSTVMSAYQYAIEQRFRLFSYGDLSVWIRQ